MSYVLLFTILKRHIICSLTTIFFCYIVILLVNNKQNILTFKLNPLCDKKTKHVKKSFDLFLLYLYNRFFLVLEALYERSCSTKEAAQPTVITTTLCSTANGESLKVLYIHPLSLGITLET